MPFSTSATFAQSRITAPTPPPAPWSSRWAVGEDRRQDQPDEVRPLSSPMIDHRPELTTQDAGRSASDSSFRLSTLEGEEQRSKQRTKVLFVQVAGDALHLLTFASQTHATLAVGPLTC
jgi:hypothetical protein